MKKTPLITTFANIETGADASTTLEEDNPAVLDRDGAGYVLARLTYTTEVHQETSDDT